MIILTLVLFIENKIINALPVLVFITPVLESITKTPNPSMSLSFKIEYTTVALTPLSLSIAFTLATSAPGCCSSLTLTTSSLGSTISGELSLTSVTCIDTGTLLDLGRLPWSRASANSA